MTADETVFVVDDNLSVRKSLCALFESAGFAVEAYASGQEFFESFDPDRVGCLLLDVRLRNSNGLDVQDELRRRDALLPVIVLTGHGNVTTAVRALKGGAIDFLQKPTPPRQLLERVRTAIEDDRNARAALHDRAAVMSRLERLTPREREVMELLLTGKTSKEIATVMRVSVRTIEGHRRRVFSKMDVASAAQLVRTVMNANDPVRPGTAAATDD